jgi:Ca2+-binding EF-hand superfamily protein
MRDEIKLELAKSSARRATSSAKVAPTGIARRTMQQKNGVRALLSMVGSLSSGAFIEVRRSVYLGFAMCGFCLARFSRAEDHRIEHHILKRAFNVIDEDGTGQLDTAELETWFNEARTNPPLTRDEIEDAKRTIDVDNSGTVSFRELWHWWNVHDPPLRLRALEADAEMEREAMLEQLAAKTSTVGKLKRLASNAQAKTPAWRSGMKKGSPPTKRGGSRTAKTRDKAAAAVGENSSVARADDTNLAFAMFAETDLRDQADVNGDNVLSRSELLAIAPAMDFSMDGRILDESEEDEAPLRTSISQAVRHEIKLLPKWADGADHSWTVRCCCASSEDLTSSDSLTCVCNEGWVNRMCAQHWLDPRCVRAGKALGSCCCDRDACLLWQACIDPLRTIGTNISVEMGVYFSNFAYIVFFLGFLAAVSFVQMYCNAVMNDAMLGYPASAGVASARYCNTTRSFVDYAAERAACCEGSGTHAFTCADVERDGTQYRYYEPGGFSTTSGLESLDTRSSHFSLTYLAHISYQWTFAGEGRFYAPGVEPLRAAFIVHFVALLVLLGALLAGARRLLRRSVFGAAALDTSMTTASDFTVEVRRLPPNARAEDIAQLFVRRGWLVDKVIVHRPHTSKSLVGKTRSAVDSLLTLDVVTKETTAKNADAKSRALHRAPSVPAPALSSLLPDGKSEDDADGRLDGADFNAVDDDAQAELLAAGTKASDAVQGAAIEALKSIETYYGPFTAPVRDAAAAAASTPVPTTETRTENEIENESAGGCAHCGVRSRFATAYVSFRYEHERQECERSFGSMGWWMPLLCCSDQVLRRDARGRLDLPFCYGMGVGCIHCRCARKCLRRKAQQELHATRAEMGHRCGYHFTDTKWLDFDYDARERLGWGASWHSGWMLWWCCGGTWGRRHRATFPPGAGSDAGGAGIVQVDLSTWDNSEHAAKLAAQSRQWNARHSLGLCVRHLCGCTISVSRAPEPDDIMWENLHTSVMTRIVSYILVTLILVGFCVTVSGISGFYIWWNLQIVLYPEVALYDEWGSVGACVWEKPAQRAQSRLYVCLRRAHVCGTSRLPPPPPPPLPTSPLPALQCSTFRSTAPSSRR